MDGIVSPALLEWGVIAFVCFVPALIVGLLLAVLKRLKEQKRDR